MSGRCTVFVEDRAWRVACVGEPGVVVRAVVCEDDADLLTRARAAAAEYDQLGGAGPVVVALPSHWCLSATIATDALGRGARRRAMAYLLEEHLPLSAEDAVADYAEHRSRALGVCAELDRLRPIVEALEQAGLDVAHLCPAALLAGACYADPHPDADGVLVSPTDADLATPADLVQLDRGVPLRWWWLTDEVALAEQLDALGGQAEERPIKLVVNTPSGMPDAPGCDWVTCETTEPDAAAASHAAKVLAGDAAAWIDLRRDALAAPGRYQAYQRPAALLAAAVALLLSCVIGVTAWRAAQYGQQADAFNAAQADAYKQAFPDAQGVPAVGVRNRLLSEQRKLEGLGGRATNGSHARSTNTEPLHPTSALTQLHDVLSALPTNQPESMRYQIQALSVQPGKVRIDGRAISSVVPEQLANALRQTGRYDVDPPSPRLLGDASWGYDFEARPIAHTQARSPSQTQTPAEHAP